MMAQRVLVGLCLVAFVHAVRVDDDDDNIMTATAAPGSGSASKSKSASGSGSADLAGDYSGPLSAAKAVLAVGGSHEDAAKAAVNSFHGASVGFDSTASQAGGEAGYPDCLKKEEASDSQSPEDIMKELSKQVEETVPRPALGVAIAMGSMQGELAGQAGISPEKAGCAAGKTALAVGGSKEEGHQTAEFVMGEASACGANKAAEAAAAEAADDAVPADDKIGMAVLKAAAAAGLDPRAGSALDPEAAKGYAAAVADKEAHEKANAADKDAGTPGAPPFVPAGASKPALVATGAASPAAAASPASAAGSDKVAADFDAVKTLADSLLPNAPNAK